MPTRNEKRSASRARPAILAALCLLCAGGCGDSRNAAGIAVTETRTYGKGQLRVIGGIPFLKLSGSSAEMGEQYGVLLKKEIAEAYKAVPGLDNRADREGNIPRLEKCLPPEYARFLKGIARGSGKDYYQVLKAAYTAYETFPGLFCSSVLIKVNGPGGKSQLLHAKNLDNGSPTGEGQAVVEFNPEGAYSYLVTEVIGFGACDGMNEEGISLSIDSGGQGARSAFPDNAVLTAKMHEIFASARNAAEAKARLKDYACDAEMILILGSGSENDGIVFDISYEKIRETRLGGQPNLFVTNTFLSPDFTPPDRLRECPRYAIIDGYMKRGAVNNLDDLIAMMSDPGTTYGVNNYQTKHAAVYDPRNKTAYLAFADSYAAWGRWLAYDWRSDTVRPYRDRSGETGPVSLRRTAAREVASIRATVMRDEDQDALWDELNAFLKRNGIGSTAPAYTLSHRTEGAFDLEVVQPVDREAPGAPRVRFSTARSMKLACVTQKGPYKTLACGYYALNRWLADNGYTASGPMRRTWLKGSWNESDQREWLTEISVPVERKPGKRR